MDLTKEILDRYVGGQIEVQNEDEGYLYRGEIATITLVGEGRDATMKITLNWMAKGEGFPPLPSRWVKDSNLTYEAGLLIYVPSHIGGGRIALASNIVGELAVLYPPGGSMLDPSRVEGLTVATSTPEA